VVKQNLNNSLPAAEEAEKIGWPKFSDGLPITDATLDKDILTTKCSMSLRPKMHIFVMPAWIAGIQVRRMRSGHPCQPGFQHSMLE
jgi:hypothetical protein